MKTTWQHVILLSVFSLSRSWTFADGASGQTAVDGQFSADHVFQSGQHEFTVANGVLFCPFVATDNRATINYTMTEFQLGYMLNDVSAAGCLRGNFELIPSGFGSAIFKGPGSYVAGATLWLRYNLAPPNWRVTPYAQIGAGVAFTDVDRGIVGQPFNFNLGAAVGLRYFVRPRYSVSLEYRYQHISNANLALHNLGTNSQGAMLGFSRSF